MTHNFEHFKLCFEVDDNHITTIQASTRPAIGEEWIVPFLGQRPMALKVMGVRIVPPPQGDEYLVFCRCEIVKN